MSAGISGFQGTEGSLGKKSGGDGAVGTPVPIPNTEVKHRSGEGSSLGGENSAPPGFFFYGGIFDLSAAFWPPFYCLDQHINFQMIPSPSAGLLRRLW